MDIEFLYRRKKPTRTNIATAKVVKFKNKSIFFGDIFHSDKASIIEPPSSPFTGRRLYTQRTIFI